MVVELAIDRIVAGGTGLAVLDGLKVFVPYAAPWERVRARLVSRKKDYAVARIEAVIEPSPVRVEPACPIFGSCGGCQLQHISYEGQLVVKKLIVNDSLQRLGRVFVPVHNMPAELPPWRYRNKTQYPVRACASNPGPGVRIGFFRSGTHDLLDVPSCLLHPESFDRLRSAVLGCFADSGETPYDEARHDGNVRHLIIRAGAREPGLLVILVTRTNSVSPNLVEHLAREPGVTGVVQSVNPDKTNRILGSGLRLLAGQAHVSQTVLDKEFLVSAPSFFQVNAGQAERLCRKVLKLAAPEGHERVLDLFCGVGMISLALAGFTSQVTGIELAPEAVADAVRSAQVNGVENVRFLAADVDEILPSIGRADIVVLDPPRRGCTPGTLKEVGAIGPRRIIYVSCNPPTLARDLRLLEELGYRTTDVELVDMFPQTHHVEVVARLDSRAWA